MNQRHKIFTWDGRRTAFVLTFLLAFALTEFGRTVYRPFVYRAGLNDFGIADTMGNHIGAVAQVFFILAVMNATRQEGLIVIGVVTIGYVGYEFVQRALPGSVSDPLDAVASVVGGVLSLTLFILIDRLMRKEQDA